MVKICLKNMDVSVFVFGRTTTVTADDGTIHRETAYVVPTTDKGRARLREASIEVTKSLSVDQVHLIQDAATLRERLAILRVNFSCPVDRLQGGKYSQLR